MRILKIMLHSMFCRQDVRKETRRIVENTKEKVTKGKTSTVVLTTSDATFGNKKRIQTFQKAIINLDTILTANHPLIDVSVHVLLQYFPKPLFRSKAAVLIPYSL